MFQIIGVLILVEITLSVSPSADNSTLTQEKLTAMHNNYKEMFANSTSCEELLQNYTFDPLTIVNEDWKRFYFWNSNDKPLHLFRFSVPYPILVDRFRSELNLTPPVDWNKTVLFMETSDDLSALFISTNVSGKFRIITNLDFYYEIPYSEMALKLVNPFYLILLNCEYRFGYGLAPFDKLPNEENIDDVVALLGIRSLFNETYLFDEITQSQLATIDESKNEDEDDDEDDYDDDEDLE